MNAPVLDLDGEASPRRVAERFGRVASMRRLGGERDANYLVISPDGEHRVLKIVGPAEAEGAIPLQVAALDHLGRTAPDLPVPRVIAARSGASVLPLTRGAAWMLTYCDGSMLSERPATDRTLAELGEATGRLVSALAGFEHVQLDRPLDWRLDAAALAVRHLASVASPPDRALAAEALQRMLAEADALARLPRQAIHGDLNPFNVVLRHDGGVVGLIDFGDLHRGWRVGDLAIALCYHLTRGEAGIGALLAGFRRWVTPTREERRLLPLLAAARLGMTVALTAAGAAARPAERDYILRNAPAAVEGLRWLADDGHERLAALAERHLA